MTLEDYRGAINARLKELGHDVDVFSAERDQIWSVGVLTPAGERHAVVAYKHNWQPNSVQGTAAILSEWLGEQAKIQA